MLKPADFQFITNRATTTVNGARFELPADGFIQLVPLGSAPNRRSDGGSLIQQVDAEALESMYNRLIERGGEMLIDFEHFSHDADKGTNAAAWLPLNADHLQNRADGLYGLPRWSAEGEAAVMGGNLRFISPEFPDSPDLLINVGGKVFRPLAVSGFGLTNRPGFRRLAKALTNKETNNSGRPTGHADNPTVHTMLHKALLALALGLPETDIEALDETTLRQKVQEMKLKLEEADKAAAASKAAEEAEADTFIKNNEKLLKTQQVRDHMRITFLNNRAVAEAIVQGMKDDDGMTEAERARAASKPLHNRQASSVTPPDRDEDAALHNRAMTYRDERKVSYEQALAACRRAPSASA